MNVSISREVPSFGIVPLLNCMQVVSHALAGSKLRGHPRHCKVMSDRIPITDYTS